MAAKAETTEDDDVQREMEKLERMAHSLDSQFRFPGTDIRFGWDSILGLIPGLGDVVTLGPAGFILYRAHKLGARKRTKARMALNVGLDWIISLVPLIGDMFDVGFKSNRKNVALLRKELEGSGTSRPLVRRA